MRTVASYTVFNLIQFT